MTNSNSFNVCSRCGSANSLSAKYCYQCGSQLKVPEEPVVCPKCHSINSSMANFCRACGSTLKTGAKTKICPRCKKEVSMSQAQCACGYSFATVRKPVDSVDNVSAKQKGGRWVALFALLFTLIFALAVTIPFRFMQDFVTQSNLFMLGVSTELGKQALGIVDLGYVCLELISAITPDNFETYLSLMVLLLLVAITLIIMAIHVISSLVRIISGKRRKGINVFYLIMFIVTALISLLFAVANNAINLTLPQAIQGYVDFCALPTNFLLGWGVFIIPAYYLFFFIFSFFAKRKKAKRRV